MDRSRKYASSNVTMMQTTVASQGRACPRKSNPTPEVQDAYLSRPSASPPAAIRECQGLASYGSFATSLPASP